VEYNSRDQLLKIDGYPYDEEDIDFVAQSFEGLWFAFPTPFEKGDVVWIPKKEAWIQWECDGGFVLDDLSAWDGHMHAAENGDNSDMNGYGFFVNENGTVYHEAMFNYMDLEFYKGPYKMNERILPALSKFIKGEIPVDMLMCAYRKVLLDLAADDIMLKGWYDHYDIKGMGLLDY
ncbi:MAG: hypothetical protein J5684_01555, partial [Eubacterium sp.]|nr:hypothetical protein [Eubacterium sp.]